MNVKKNLLIFTLLSVVLSLILLNYKNTSKTNINLFTWKSNDLSIGNLINISFIAGFTLGSLFLLSNSTSIKESEKEKLYDEDDEPDEKNEIWDTSFSKQRPPERDIRDNQPTISVNYRVIGQNNEFNEGKENNNDEDIDDWSNNSLEW